jgi:linearmycin/streptolysin S transport system permease protein
MRTILNIAQNDLRIFFASRGNLIGLLLIPTIFVFVIGFATTVPERMFNITIIDEDNTAESQQFIAEVAESNSAFVINEGVLNLDEALVNVAEGSISAVIHIPENFAENIQNFQEVQIDYYSNTTPGSPEIVRQSIESVIGRWNGAVIAAQVGSQIADTLELEIESRAIYDAANDILAQEPVAYEYTLTEIDDGQAQVGQGLSQAVPGMGSMFVMLTVMGGMTVLLRERRTWTLQRLVMMPISRSQILGGKILTYFTLGMIQYLLLFLLGILTGTRFGNNALALVLVMATFSLAVTALTFALATRVRTEGQATALPTMIALLLASLGGAWWPLEIVPPIMRTVGHLSPIAWAMDAFNAIIYFDGGLVDVLPSLGVLLAFAAIFFVIGVRGFRYE